jgi:hypothetical protein
LGNIRKYDASLGEGESSGVMKDVFRKMKWQASQKLEAAMRLEAEIVAYLGAINLLLGLYKVYAFHSTLEALDPQKELLITDLEKSTLLQSKEPEGGSKVLPQHLQISTSRRKRLPKTLHKYDIESMKVHVLFENTLRSPPRKHLRR